MEFWGAEVKNGESYKVVPDEDKLVHISKASLGEVKKEKGNEHVHLYVKIGGQKLGLGTLITEKISQISFDLAFEKEFELSHTGKNGSVFITGYSLTNPCMDENEDDEYDSDETIPPISSAAGKPNSDQCTKTKPAASKLKVTMNGEVETNDGDDDSMESDARTVKRRYRPRRGIGWNLPTKLLLQRINQKRALQKTLMEQRNTMYRLLLLIQLILIRRLLRRRRLRNRHLNQA